MRPRREPTGPGQESVWDYPRPPRVDPDDRRVRIVCAGRTIVDTRDAVRVLETSHPPGWYVPIAALTGAHLQAVDMTTWCEFKGRASYWDLVVDSADTAVCSQAAWSYPHPTAGFEVLADRFTVYPGRVDACFVGEEQVRAQVGGFYGGWITDELTGPFKGERGTLGW